MKLIRRRTAIVATTLAALLLAGCGGDPSSGPGGGEQASGDPVQGGSLTFLGVNEPANLDPASFSNPRPADCLLT